MVNSLRKKHISLSLISAQSHIKKSIYSDTANFLREKGTNRDRRWHLTHIYLHIVANKSKHQGIIILLDLTNLTE